MEQFYRTDANGNDIIDTPYVVNQTTGSIDYLPTSIDNFSAIFPATHISNPGIFVQTHDTNMSFR
jgi:hypothetical protein